MEKSAADALFVQKTPGQAHLSFTMAALTTIGGLTGFLRANSLGSVRTENQKMCFDSTIMIIIIILVRVHMVQER